MAMKKMKLGKTKLEISRVGMGGIPIQRPSEKEAIKIIRRALDLGITFIDTAVGYGDSEGRIGKAITGRRDQVVIATKTPSREKDPALKHLEVSLQRLQTDYIDVWQFHLINNFDEYHQVLGPGGAMEAAQEALQAGKIRYIGLSTHNVEVAKEAITSGQFSTIQFPFNFISNEAAEELIPLAQEHDVGFIAMKPFAGGMIRNANLAIKYLLQFDGVVPDPGVEKLSEIEEIVEIVNGSWELTTQDHQRMEEIRRELGTRFCRWCEYCLPCPQGVQINWVVSVWHLWKVWPPKIFFERMAERIETGRNCLDCGECETKCPYKLPIREMIAENMELFDKIVQ
jgi:predicted aldo/keto reductase-like oxidoreductase